MLPLPSGQYAAISSDWWWKPTNGPTSEAVTSPLATWVLGPISEPSTQPCSSTGGVLAQHAVADDAAAGGVGRRAAAATR